MKWHKTCHIPHHCQKNRNHNPKTLKMKPWATKNPGIQSPVNPWPRNRQGSEWAFTFPNLMTTGCSISKPTYYFCFTPWHDLLSCIQRNTSTFVRVFGSILTSEFWSLVHKTEHPQWIKKPTLRPFSFSQERVWVLFKFFVCSRGWHWLQNTTTPPWKQGPTWNTVTS